MINLTPDTTFENVRARIESALLEGRIAYFCQIVILLRDGVSLTTPQPCERSHIEPRVMYELLARLTEYDEDGHLNIVPAREWIEDLKRSPDLLRRIDRDAILYALTRQQHVHAVNLSAETLNDYAFLSFVSENLADPTIDRDSVHFEVTENTALKPASLAALQQIRGFGYRWIGLDDFGKRENGFDALARVQPRFLKIDLDYSVGLISDSRIDNQVAHAIVKGILVMAQELGIGCVAEGVENEAIETALLEIHDTVAPRVTLYGQGWLYGKPESCDEVDVT